MNALRAVRPITVAAGIAGLAALAAGYTAAGAAGLAMVGTGLAVVALVAAWSQQRGQIQQGVPTRQHPTGAGPAGASRFTGPLRRRRGAAAATVSDFPSFRRIEADLGWAGVSRRHFDHVVRPRLTRLMSAALADGHRVDAAREPERARRIAGADLWAALDPARPASDDGNAPGADVTTLARIISRLEDL